VGFLKFGDVWKGLEKTKKISPISNLLLKLLSNDSQLGCLSFFSVFLSFSVPLLSFPAKPHNFNVKMRTSLSSGSG
jgi:hypothetical protein